MYLGSLRLTCSMKSEVPGDGRDQYDQVNEDEEGPRTNYPNRHPARQEDNSPHEDTYEEPTDSENEEPISMPPVRPRNNSVAALQSPSAPPPPVPPPPPASPSAVAGSPRSDLRNGARGRNSERGVSPANSLIDFDQSPIVPVTVRVHTASTSKPHAQSPSQSPSSTSLNAPAAGILVSSFGTQRRQQHDTRRKATPPAGPAAPTVTSSRISGGDISSATMPRRQPSFKLPPVPPPPSPLPLFPLPESSAASSHDSAVASNNGG